MSDINTPNDQQEDSSDFSGVSPTDFSDAVVTATDWTTQTVLMQLSKGNIELNPSFQRRDAWKPERKSKFIESLIIGIPVPQLVLAERKGKKNSFIVIDGKQRLLSLRQFCSVAEDDDYKKYSLSSLEIRDDLNGVNYEQLCENEHYSQHLTNFENQPIRTVVIRNWPNEKFLYQVFLRLNTGSVPLSPQELRQALHPGEFSSFIDTFSAESKEIRRILGLKTPDFRMRDAELVIRYFSFRNYLDKYTGNLSPLFDSTTDRLNKIWVEDNSLVKKQSEYLKYAIQTTIEIFKGNAFRKWNGKSYEKALNRAVFDVMVLFFDNEITGNAALTHKDEIETAFKDLCEKDVHFRSAVEGTTKSIDAIFTRLSHWAERLRPILGDSNINMPSLVDGRIVL